MVGPVPIEALQALYTKLFRLTLQQEGWGVELTTPELHLQIDPDMVSVSLKNKLSQNAGDQRRTLIRYPDWYAPNAKSVLKSLISRSVLKSLIPRLVQKCLHYASLPDTMVNNIQCILQEITKKGYWEVLGTGIQQDAVPAWGPTESDSHHAQDLRLALSHVVVTTYRGQTSCERGGEWERTSE